MNAQDLPQSVTSLAVTSDGAGLLSPLLQGTVAAPAGPSASPGLPAAPIFGVVVGDLLALDDGGATPLIRCTQVTGPSTVRARSAVDLQGQHIGQQVLVTFEQGDATRPIVTGVLRPQAGWPLADAPAQVSVDVDGERLVVTAKEQLVLRCGKASITLTKAGKVLIEGQYVLSRSSGVNRIKGGSVQLN